MVTLSPSDSQASSFAFTRRITSSVNAVVDASLVQPSNFSDGSVNPGFASTQAGTLKALNNGRTAGLRGAYQRGTADTYKAEMTADAVACRRIRASSSSAT